MRHQQQLRNSKRPNTSGEQTSRRPRRRMDTARILARCVAASTTIFVGPYHLDRTHPATDISDLQPNGVFTLSVVHGTLDATLEAPARNCPPLSSHVPFQTPQILCSGTSHTVQYFTDTYTAKLTSHQRPTRIVLRQIVPALLATER
jgi:hypothetical protein